MDKAEIKRLLIQGQNLYKAFVAKGNTAEGFQQQISAYDQAIAALEAEQEPVAEIQIRKGVASLNMRQSAFERLSDGIHSVYTVPPAQAASDAEYWKQIAKDAMKKNVSLLAKSSAQAAAVPDRIKAKDARNFISEPSLLEAERFAQGFNCCIDALNAAPVTGEYLADEIHKAAEWAKEEYFTRDLPDTGVVHAFNLMHEYAENIEGGVE